MLTTRVLTDAQMDDFVTVLWGAFLIDFQPGERERELALLEPARTHGIFDGDTLVGGGSVLTRSMTLPGVGPTPIAGVTSVGIAPDHRRRGGLSTLMRAQLHGLHEAGGEPVAALWASEAVIYGRYGYGLAARRTRTAVPSDTRLRDDLDFGDGQVTLLDAEAAQPALRKLHGEYTATRVGSLSRPQVGWDYQFADEPHHRDGATSFRYAVHPEGYAVFRIKEDWQPRGPQHEVRVRELVSVTPAAHAALWRFLINLDLGGEVRYTNAPLDEPLPFMLADPRAATVTVTDALFVRLVDVDRALTARRYVGPVDLVFEVVDELCPWNAGRWRLAVDGSGGASVSRSSAEPDLVCGVDDLGAVYLGGTRLSALAAAGRVRELRPGALRAATLAFAGDHEPHCLEVF